MNRLSNLEIDALEKEMGAAMPGLFRKLLVEMGWGEFRHVEIYHPTQIRELYQFHFENEEDLFGKYFPFGCNNARQEIWLIRPADERAAVIWHETHSDDYDSEDWLDYAAWLVLLEEYIPLNS